jgi:lysyl endopeptidase
LGSWVYRGEYLTIEIKTPNRTVGDLILHANNIAYGYKGVYETRTAGFGTSASCNINVLCPLGTGWEAERNSVALILDDKGQDWCSGAMIMNTCNSNRPFFLTANHCFTGQDVTKWRFMFQAFSPTCTPNQNSNGVTFNGSTLRANSAGTDMCLVELNNTPPANSGINYAGWNRSTTGISQATIIHHPNGDVMKITRDNDAPIFDNFGGAQCWRLTTDQGTTEGGSSGGPYFDQNRRIIGQHFGIDDGNLAICNQVRKFGGRFDLSWTGGGTNTTRLSNWLDPANNNQQAINTANIANLQAYVDVNSLAILGPQLICNSADYSISNLPTGAIVTWSISTGGATLILAPNTPLVNQLRITNKKFYLVTPILTALISNLGCEIPNQTRVMTIANDVSTAVSYAYTQEACTFYNVPHPSQSGTIVSNSSPVFVHQGCMVYVNIGIGRTVTLGSGGTPLFWGFGPSYYPNSLYFQLPLGSGGTPFTFTVGGNGACSQRTLLFFSYSGNARYAFAATPNPAKDQLTVTAKEDEVYLAENKLSSTKESLQFTMNIYDAATNALQMTQLSDVGSMQHSLNVSNLKTGYYVLQIVNGKETQSIKFFKE